MLCLLSFVFNVYLSFRFHLLYEELRQVFEIQELRKGGLHEEVPGCGPNNSSAQR